MSFFSEFKQFAMRGNVMDLAVAVLMGAAFGKIVSSFVDGIIMPLIGLLIGGMNISNKSLKIGEAVVKWGSLLEAIIDFAIIAFAIFVAIKFINILQNKKEENEQKLSREASILIEIRDLLKSESSEK